MCKSAHGGSWATTGVEGFHVPGGVQTMHMFLRRLEVAVDVAEMFLSCSGKSTHCSGFVDYRSIDIEDTFIYAPAPCTSLSKNTYKNPRKNTIPPYDAHFLSSRIPVGVP